MSEANPNYVPVIWDGERAKVGDMPPPGAELPEGCVLGDGRRRLKSCVEAWPECDSGEYNPACCRYPKSCSATCIRGEVITDEYYESLTPKFPKGTPEYDAYRTDLKVELDKFVKGEGEYQVEVTSEKPTEAEMVRIGSGGNATLNSAGDPIKIGDRVHHIADVNQSKRSVGVVTYVGEVEVLRTVVENGVRCKWDGSGKEESHHVDQLTVCPPD